MQTKLIEAHARQAGEPFREVEKLLGTLIEGWSVASESLPRVECADEEYATAESTESLSYGAYWSEPVEAAVSGAAFSF